MLYEKTFWVSQTCRLLLKIRRVWLRKEFLCIALLALTKYLRGCSEKEASAITSLFMKYSFLINEPFPNSIRRFKIVSELSFFSRPKVNWTSTKFISESPFFLLKIMIHQGSGLLSSKRHHLIASRMFVYPVSCTPRITLIFGLKSICVWFAKDLNP